MEITCEQCDTTLKLPEDKLPKNQTVRVTCPKCRNKIAVNRKPVSDTCNVTGDPLDLADTDRKRSLVCENNASASNSITSTLKGMNYHVTEAASQQEALKRIRLHHYDLVVMNESFETGTPEDNHVLRHLNHLSMATRRNIFVALVGTGFRTMDNMTAFATSVNVVINPKDFNHLETILKKSMTQHAEFYKVFKSVLKSTEL